MTANETRGPFARTLLILGRLILAAIFLVAAYAKLKPQAAVPWSAASVKTSLSLFAMQVDSYQLLPPQLVSPVAHLLPPFELFLGLWLLSGGFLPYSAVVTTLLIAAFFATQVRTYRAGLEINCGCFGPGGCGRAAGRFRLRPAWRGLCLPPRLSQRHRRPDSRGHA